MESAYRQLLVKILLKKAKGYAYKEKTDEFVVSDGEKQLVKSKVITKRVQPDVNAVKVLLQLDNDGLNINEMTDDELKREKLRLIKLLEECETSNSVGNAAETE
ncbi:MAG: hypothetical protein NC099_04315 [Corallococcus sp.]|nr:hypothetical protein [Bacillota bacterium]MCM1533861.1 hypothetical protein [Corallococcus sp.]